MTFQIASFHRLLISLAFFLSVAAGLPASAAHQPANEWPSMTVKFGDLDLNTDAGRRELLDRLNKAVRRVCAEYANANWDLGYYRDYGSCVSSSLAAAVDKIHHQQLSALFATTSRLNTR
jgi:UrcA family protein